MKVTIVVPCFNQGKYLSETLNSVIVQSFCDWECIIINDGSTDKTELIALSYVRKDQRFRYLYQENAGVCAARNNGIKMATGKYILCLDPDDKISSEYLLLAVKELDKDEKVGLVVCNYEYFGTRKGKVVLEPYSIEKLLGHNLFVNCSMFRKRDFDNVHGFNNNMALGFEDWDLWLSILSNGKRVRYLEGFHFYYRIKASKKSRNKFAALNNSCFLRKQIWENHHELYSKYFFSPIESFEYLAIAKSKEYLLGSLLLKPVRFVMSLFDY